MKHLLKAQTDPEALVCHDDAGNKIFLKDVRRVLPRSLDTQGEVFKEHRSDKELYLNDSILNAYLALLRKESPDP